jgi:hypothetical protein
MSIAILILISVALAFVAFGPGTGLKEGMNGYTKEFNLARPWPGQCVCDDGSPGTLALGYGGECVCPSDQAAQVVTPQGIIAPPPGDYETSGLLWPFN